MLNPLFLDDLREKLERVGDNARMLLNLRKRILDQGLRPGLRFRATSWSSPTSEMCAIEAEINRRRNEPDRASEIPVTNFRGIELRDFRRKSLALRWSSPSTSATCCTGAEAGPAEFPAAAQRELDHLRERATADWLSICPPTGTGVKVQADDLFGSPLDQAEIDFENEGGETYICGNPPYLGNTWQSPEQRADIRNIVSGRTGSPGFWTM